jgi:hypothetical protein
VSFLHISSQPPPPPVRAPAPRAPAQPRRVRRRTSPAWRAAPVSAVMLGGRPPQISAHGAAYADGRPRSPRVCFAPPAPRVSHPHPRGVVPPSPTTCMSSSTSRAARFAELVTPTPLHPTGGNRALPVLPQLRRVLIEHDLQRAARHPAERPRAHPRGQGGGSLRTNRRRARTARSAGGSEPDAIRGGRRADSGRWTRRRTNPYDRG